MYILCECRFSLPFVAKRLIESVLLLECLCVVCE